MEADRPGDLVGFQPEGARLGYQGPDQGYAIKIANGFRDRLRLQPGEHVADVIQGCLGIALRRASMFSRAPVVHDLTIAFTIWGFLDGNPPSELLSQRLRVVRGRQQHVASLRRGPRAGRHGARDHAAHDAGAGHGRVPRKMEGVVGRMNQPINLTDEQREFRAVVRRFADDKIAPRAAETDEKAEYDWEAFKALVAADLTSLQYPRSTAARVRRSSTQAIAAEELARACASTSLMFLISKLGMLPVLNFGSEELKARSAAADLRRAAARRATASARPTPAATLRR